MKLTLNELKYIVVECTKRIINEAYLGDLYHHTTLSHLYSILKHNAIFRTDDIEQDSRMSDNWLICLTRSKDGSYRKSSIDCIITLDGEKMSTSLRHAKIHPFNYGKAEDGVSEMEERLYGNDIKPLSKYCKSIDIFVTDINVVDYDYCDDIEIAYEGLSNEGNNKPTDSDINKWYLNHIIKDFPVFAHLIHIHKK
jgi:hypothetical protein